MQNLFPCKSRTALAIIACLMLGSCASNEKSFEGMSIEELALYNSTVDLADTVYCVEREARTGTRIRSTYCATLLEIANAVENQSVSNPASLGTISTGRGSTLGGGAQFPRSSIPRN